VKENNSEGLLLRNVLFVVCLPGLDVLLHQTDVLSVMLGKWSLSVHQIALNLGILKIKNFRLKLFKLGISHFLCVQQQVVT
jgi:hypothetical protein